MHTTFRESSSIRQAPDARFALFTNRVENDNTLAPQSHDVGPCSEGWLKSCMKSALQSTRSMAICPTLCGCPMEGIHLRRDSKGTTVVTENRLKPGPLEI